MQEVVFNAMTLNSSPQEMVMTIPSTKTPFEMPEIKQDTARLHGTNTL